MSKIKPYRLAVKYLNTIKGNLMGDENLSRASTESSELHLDEKMERTCNITNSQRFFSSSPKTSIYLIKPKNSSAQQDQNELIQQYKNEPIEFKYLPLGQVPEYYLKIVNVIIMCQVNHIDDVEHIEGFLSDKTILGPTIIIVSQEMDITAERYQQFKNQITGAIFIGIDEFLRDEILESVIIKYQSKQEKKEISEVQEVVPEIDNSICCKLI